MTPVRRRLAAAAALLVAGLAFLPAVSAEGAAPRFREVDRLPLFDHPATNSSRSGWLILNPVSRRGYQIFEVATPTNHTVVQSFDLDTLKPLRRVTLAGVPIVGGTGNVLVAGNTGSAAEPVHAVDEEGRRLYLALGYPQATDTTATHIANAAVGGSTDGKRPLARFVAIDEDALDRGDPAFAASFREPAGQERLHQYWVAGMATNGSRLLVLFAHPQPGRLAFYDHTLAQWDPSGLAFSAGAALETAPNAIGLTVPGQLAVQQVSSAGLPRRLDACGSASLASRGAQGNHQWGLLVTATAVWTACQTAEGQGAAVQVPLEATTGHLDPVATHAVHRLGRRISDVLVDDGNDRLLVRTFGGRDQLWLFETTAPTFVGSIAVKETDGYSAALGVHPTTGRLYALVQDYERFENGTSVAYQGGLQYSDPPGALVNVRPDLAYPANYAIRVDPATKRFFARLGHPAFSTTPVYPGVDSTTPAPAEPFYRVFDDRAK